MHEQIVTGAQHEVLRLLTEQQEVLTELLETPDLLRDEQTDQLRSVTRQTAREWLEALREEHLKVERLELTVAVVGTVKAGKSTTINAIVGTEVLPNRNHPMTTLPTLIRHRADQQVPVLTFGKTEPFNLAVSQLRDVLVGMQADGHLQARLDGAGEDEAELINTLITNPPRVEGRYEGPDEIFAFLKLINDVARFCQEFDIDSPLLDYAQLEEFPLIEVEFSHLRGAEQGPAQGRFTLIDTPGPNESGQPHLRKVLAGQFKRASAVLAVLNYTQLGTEAEAELQASLSQFAEEYRDGLSVLVNRFDERDARGMQEDEVRRHVARRLFNEKVPMDRIEPVSALWGYLATRALLELDRNGRLPDPDGCPWVKKFGEVAFGPLWRRQIAKPEAVRENAEALWEASSFQGALDGIVRRASSRAALFSLLAALDKMSVIDYHMDNHLGRRFQALQADVEFLKAQIMALEQDIEQVGVTHKEAHRAVRGLFNDMIEEIHNLFDNAEGALRERVEELIAEGKIKWQEHVTQQGFQPGPTGLAGAWAAFFGREQPGAQRRADLEWNPNGPSKFKTRLEATDFASNLKQAAGEACSPIMDGLEIEARERVDELKVRVQAEVAQRLGATLQAAQERLREAFGQELSFSEFDLSDLRVDFQDIAVNAIKKTQEARTVFRYVRKWWTLWLYDHREEVTEFETVHVVDGKQVLRDFRDNMKTAQREMQAQLKEYVEEALSRGVDQYFDELAAYLERFRGDLADALLDRKLDAARLASLGEAMDDAILIVGQHKDDVMTLRQGLGAETRGVPAR